MSNAWPLGHPPSQPCWNTSAPISCCKTDLLSQAPCPIDSGKRSAETFFTGISSTQRRSSSWNQCMFPTQCQAGKIKTSIGSWSDSLDPLWYGCRHFANLFLFSSKTIGGVLNMLCWVGWGRHIIFSDPDPLISRVFLHISEPLSSGVFLSSRAMMLRVQQRWKIPFLGVADHAFA